MEHHRIDSRRRRVVQGLARKSAEDPALREAMEKANLGFAYLDAAEFGQAMHNDNEYFKSLVQKLGIKS